MVLWYIWSQGGQPCVLLVLQVLQGHPKSGKLWEQLINSILMGLELKFKHTTYDCTIYKTIFKGHSVLLLRQVDDMMIQTDGEDIAKIYLTSSD